MKTSKIIPAFLAAAMLLGCGAPQPVPAANTSEPIFSLESPAPIETAPPAAIQADTLFSNRDLEGGVDLSKAAAITLLGNSAETDAPGVGIDGSTVTIGQEGIYILTGTLNGQIIVAAGKNDKVQLVLQNAEIASASSAAIYCKSADKVFLTLAEESSNQLANGGSFAAIDDTAIDGTIYSKTDLTLNGKGSLSIASPAGHGIVSKDELVITGGSYQISAGQHGLVGKDCVSIANGVFQISSGEDGIHAKHSEDAAAGFLYIGGGSFTVNAGLDGLSATGPIEIHDGSFELTTGGGSQAVAMRPSDGMAQRQSGASSYSSSVSAKGIKADGSIHILGGSFRLDCADDGLHAGGNLEIQSGSFHIQTADDGIHSDENVTISDGSISIPYCYEGIEGQNVTVNGGKIDIVSQDDGINAAGGMDRSGLDSRQRPQFTAAPGETSTQQPPDAVTAPTADTDRPQRGEGHRKDGGMGRGGFGGRDNSGSSGGNSSIIINGGTIHIDSQGDSLDSNGSISLTGGSLTLNCAGFGNTAIDCDGSFSNTGAQVTTNDGSENGGMFTQRKAR